MRFPAIRPKIAVEMDDLTSDQTETLVAELIRVRNELRALLDSTRDQTRPVDLDEPIGRLTRIDAIQQQHMTTATRRSHDLRLRQIEQALRLAEAGDYGLCRKCEEPIGLARLTARPESPYCLECQDGIDRKFS